VNDFVTGQALRAGEMDQRRGTDPTVVQAAVEYGRGLLRSGGYPFIEALSADPASTGILDEQRFEEQFERGLWLLIDGSTSGTSIDGPGQMHSTR